MNLYLVKSLQGFGWDSWDSFVIACESENEARYTHPCDTCYIWNHEYNEWYDKEYGEIATYHGWTCDPRTLTVTFLGTTDIYDKPTVVISSFNAG
jgi:hypothetical protein